MKHKKNLILHLISLGILGVGYVLTRYIFFDEHGMKQWPLVLFVCGIVIISVSFFREGKAGSGDNCSILHRWICSRRCLSD